MPFSIRLHTTKSKHIVPIVNDTPIHSLLNPVREAEVFATNFMSQVSSNSNILILGLGFAYHVEELQKLLNVKHKIHRIYVVEGIGELSKSCLSYQKLDKSIRVFHTTNPNDLFFDEDFCHFLLSKPTIIMHPVLYKLNEAYYKTILTRRASADTREWRHPNLNNYSIDKALKWQDAIREIKHAEF